MDPLTLVIVVALAGPGLANILAYGSIFAPFRKLIGVVQDDEAGNRSMLSEAIADMMYCSICFGFWTGIGVFVMCGCPIITHVEVPWVGILSSMMVCGLVSSCSSLIISTVTSS